MSSHKELSSHRKLAIKRSDGEPLTRSDLQYDLLCCIFDDKHAVFTNPYRITGDDHPPPKVTFRDLYVDALVSSPRSSKAHRDKLIDSPDFGTDFAKISLLANVGRINTTMAFFPEMRTTLRTYHPVPALQKTEGSLQDAPRIKNTLKACLLPNEVQIPPSTPSDVLVRAHSGTVPSTSVVNLIFIMSNHSVAVGRSHLGPDVEFIDLFIPSRYPSAMKAQAFLWLCYHYLESPTGPNPFDDDYSRKHPSHAPALHDISVVEITTENRDTPEEIAWGKKKTMERQVFLQKEKEDAATQAKAAREKQQQAHRDQEATPGPADKTTKKTKATKEKLVADPNTRKIVAAADPAIRGKVSKALASRRRAMRADDRSGRQSREALQHKTSHQRLLPDTSMQAAAGEPYPHLPPLRPATNAVVDSRAKATRGRKSKVVREVRPPVQYEVVYAPPSPERTMFEHAWHIVSTTDPLVDSDEDNADEHVRLDYTRRLKTLTRLRGKSPTPEPLPQQPTMDIDNRGW